MRRYSINYFQQTILSIVFLLSFFLLLQQPAAAQYKNDKKLESMLKALVDSFHGVAGVYVHNIATGREAAVNADTIFPTASIVKVPILVGIFDQIHKGVYKYHQSLTYRDSAARKGSGLMQFFKDSSATDLCTAIALMMNYSDNTTAVWCERMAGGGIVINAWLDAHGFQSTRVNNRTPGREQNRQLYGWGQTTPREMSRLLTMIRNNEVISPEISETMYRIMTHSFYDENAVSQTPPYVASASKQGMVDDSRSEVVLVNAPHGDYVFYVATKDNKDRRWVPDNEASQLERKVSALLWKYFEPRSKWKPAAGTEQLWY